MYFSKKVANLSSVKIGEHLTGLNLQSHHFPKAGVVTEAWDGFSAVEAIAPPFSQGHFSQDELASKFVQGRAEVRKQILHMHSNMCCG